MCLGRRNGTCFCSKLFLIHDLPVMTGEYHVDTAGFREGTAAMFDPIHHIALIDTFLGEASSSVMLITGATAPPRSIAQRDLSHYSPTGPLVIGATLASIEAMYGPLHLTSRCGMQAGTYVVKAEGGAPTTYVFKNGRVIAVSVYLVNG